MRWQKKWQPSLHTLLAVIVSVVCLASGTVYAGVKEASTLAATGTLPGATAYNDALLKKIGKKNAGLKSYNPRTRHLNPDGTPKFTNRLFLETSPYLLQHAHNPVNWFPWGDEAFELAKKLKRPVLLSVGYSTCHWCHVMEEESFEDLEIATYLNEHYVAIKVDREERPDIDSIYMAAVEALTGQGGWPMNTWLTPDRKPYYGGTYFPARDGERGAPVGFLTLLSTLYDIYQKETEKVVQQSDEIVRVIKDSLTVEVSGKQVPGVDVLNAGIDYFKVAFDPENGGVGTAPKFPSGLPIRFLLRRQLKTGDATLSDMTDLTLSRMASGGMYDHVGGGFHRYSTDAKWLVPHFEKMLYDNALLVLTYLEAYQADKNPVYLRVIRESLTYVEREMMSAEGGFYAATDADSRVPGGKSDEGYFFSWTPAEIDSVLEKNASATIQSYYGVTAAGNFEGRNILHTSVAAKSSLEKQAAESGLATSLVQSRNVLYQARLKRPAPLRDEKIITSWNGLMISAFARAGFVLNDQHLIVVAVRAATFLKNKLLVQGRLYRSFKDGEISEQGFIEDYAFYSQAVLDVFESTQNISWLELAVDLDQTLSKHYEDKKDGGFFLIADSSSGLLVREKSAKDRAIPSGNSVHALNLLRLLELTSVDTYRKRVVALFTGFSNGIAKIPAAHTEMLNALEYFHAKPLEIVIVAPEGGRKNLEPFLNEIRYRFIPNKVVVAVTEGSELQAAMKHIPLLEGKLAIKGVTTAYLCQAKVCRFPVSDPNTFGEQLQKTRNQ